MAASAIWWVRPPRSDAGLLGFGEVGFHQAGELGQAPEADGAGGALAGRGLRRAASRSRSSRSRGRRRSRRSAAAPPRRRTSSSSGSGCRLSRSFARHLLLTACGQPLDAEGALERRRGSCPRGRSRTATARSAGGRPAPAACTPLPGSLSLKISMWMNAASSPYVLFDLLGHVDDGAADPTLAELGGRKQEDDRFLAQDVGEVDLVLGVGRDARRDLGEVAADVRGGRRVDRRRLLPHPAERGRTRRRRRWAAASPSFRRLP